MISKSRSHQTHWQTIWTLLNLVFFLPACFWGCRRKPRVPGVDPQGHGEDMLTPGIGTRVLPAVMRQCWPLRHSASRELIKADCMYKKKQDPAMCHTYNTLITPSHRDMSVYFINLNKILNNWSLSLSAMTLLHVYGCQAFSWHCMRPFHTTIINGTTWAQEHLSHIRKLKERQSDTLLTKSLDWRRLVCCGQHVVKKKKNPNYPNFS